MSAEGIRTLSDVPVLRRTLDRPSLVDEILSQPSPIIILSAPGGYGKTTAATQAVVQAGEDVLWLDCVGVESDEGFRSLVRRECAVAKREAERVYTLLPGLSADESAAQAVMDVLHVLREPSWIVLDSIELDCGKLGFDDVLQVLRPLTRRGHRAILTTRTPCIVAGGTSAATLPTEALLLDCEETKRVAELYGVSLTDDEASRIQSTAKGQVALTVTLLGWARQQSIQSVLSGEHGGDLAGLLRGLVSSQMGERGMDLFISAALMREGSVSQLKRAAGDAPLGLLEFGASCVPLLSLQCEDGVPSRFRLHDLGVAAFGDSAHSADIAPGVRQACLDELAAEGRYAECLRILARGDSAEDLADGLEDWGDAVHVQGHSGLLHTALDRLDSVTFLGRHRLLLLQARVLIDSGCPDRAVARASVARDLARADEDHETLARALETIARASIDMGNLGSAEENLKELLGLDRLATSASVRVLAGSYLGVCSAVAGRVDEALSQLSDAERLLKESEVEPDVEGRIALSKGYVVGLLKGDSAEAVRLLSELLTRQGLSLSMRTQISNNFAHLLIETARCEQASGLLLDLEAEASVYGPASLLPTVRVSLSDACGAAGEYERATEYYRMAMETSDVTPVDSVLALCNRSLWARASGDIEGALQSAEECLGLLGGSPQAVTEWLTILEIAASLLALGDVRAAKKRATSVRRDAVEAGAAYHVLRADMILAEVARIEGDLPAAVEHFGQHHEYILTESSNWQIGMYIRSFPSLLGILAMSIDPDDLPVHLLKMVLPEDAEEALLAAREVMDPELWMRLASRIVDKDEAVRLRDGDGPQQCRVRMFGGLRVKVGDRLVADRDWRKRKARLLFAMLVLNRGQDVSRDQVLEYLWPDMDDERARNNFYVIWSAMKSALAPDADKTTPCPYMDNSTGMLRSVPEFIKSDVDDFEELVASAELAVLDSDTRAALSAYERLYGVYRGELLPGDLYEDWFATTRDRYRQEFGDSMFAASQLLLAEGDAGRALKYLRKALDHDPWREDLYQASLKCQIAAGQRSAAVETFFSCKDKLAEELGLDPSQETMRLYDQVLAMEDLGDSPTGSYG